MTMKERVSAAIERFFFRPASPRPLAALRIVLSVILIIQGLFIAPALLELYGRQGLMQGPLLDYLMLPFGTALPSLSWLPKELAGQSIAGDLWLSGAFYAYMLALVFLLAGCWTRLAAGVAVITHWLLLGAGFWSSYGADRFAQIALFYFIWMPVSEMWSMDSRMRLPSNATDPYPTARVSVRILQIHLCIVYLSTAIAKSHGHVWWSGEAVWLALMSYGVPAAQAGALKFAPHAWIFRLLSWGTLLTEYAYVLLVWPKSTRLPMVLAICALHVGIAFSMGLVSFSMIMVALTATIFGVSGELRDRAESEGLFTPEPSHGELRSTLPPLGPAPSPSLF